eukprot:TRINITY_DN8478_c0_g1_i1.p2 TRINITY_DN8478_c0_g1~~TRINITY_DN8478_c0_g1_i1.p2  ORF type:complete len:260 (+),score=23.55 TRINITY_DN8478_c0_g1_i1:141-920(+)
MIRRPPRSTHCISSAASDVYKRQNQNFVSSSFHHNQVLYYTGDIGRVLFDYNIEFIGRQDEQINLNGYRIELEEIKNVLNQHGKINDSSIMIRDTGNNTKGIIAYYASEILIDNAELKEYLLKYVPSYMIPVMFIGLKNFPLTSNGKIDISSLPNPQISNRAHVDFISPRTNIEEMLVRIWQDVLQTKEISINDGFFNIGGDSIKTISIINSINNELNLKLELYDLYRNETVEKLAKRITDLIQCPVQIGFIQFYSTHY